MVLDSGFPADCLANHVARIFKETANDSLLRVEKAGLLLLAVLCFTSWPGEYRPLTSGFRIGNEPACRAGAQN
jgi:hypothetical protein